MKKTLIPLLFLFILAGCGLGTNASADLTLDAFIDAFENEGIIFDEEKPLYGMIGAKDGVINQDDGKIALYEFESEDDIKEAKESLPAMEGWEKKGLFLLETSNEKAIEIFNSVE